MGVPRPWTGHMACSDLSPPVGHQIKQLCWCVRARAVLEEIASREQSFFSPSGPRFKGEQQTRRCPDSLQRCEKPLQDQLRVPKRRDVPFLRGGRSPALTGRPDGNSASLES